MHSLAREWCELSGRLVRSGTESGLRYSEVGYDVGSTQAGHPHRAPFFTLSLHGTYWEEVSGLVFECVPHTVIFHPSGAEHAITVVLSPARCFMLELEGDEIARRYQVRLSPVVLQAHGGPMASALHDIHDRFRLHENGSPLAIQGALTQLLGGASGPAQERENGLQRLLMQITDLLRERFRERLTIEEIAGAVGLSPSRVSNIFRGAHGCTIAEEQRRLRIEYARHRINEGAVSLAGIAREAGFADQAHFSRAFKRVTGMTPGRYRQTVHAV